MRRSFSLVDDKVAEADFFLKRIPESGSDLFAVRYYASAFVAAVRSVTFALQSVLDDALGFKQWYEQRRDELRRDPLARFFNQFRRASQHVGENPVRGASIRPGSPTLYWFTPTHDVPDVPSQDVETACRQYLRNILELVYACYVDFGPYIDAKQHYTAENFAKLGKTVDDAEEELFGTRGYTNVQGVAEKYRWQFIRDSQLGCEINHLFEEYLGKTTPCPERLPGLPPPKGKGWSDIPGKGRVFIPKPFRKTGDPERDLQLYIRSLRRARRGSQDSHDVRA